MFKLFGAKVFNLQIHWSSWYPRAAAVLVLFSNMVTLRSSFKLWFSWKSDYLLNSEILCKKFIERGFHEKELKKTVKQVAKMDRNELLRDRISENKDPQTILVSTWHPKLSAIPSILKNNFHLISSDPKLSKTFKQKPTVTYRKNKSLSDHLLKNDIANQQFHSNVTPCGKCKLCPQINTAKLITNDKLNITEKIKGTGNWKLETGTGNN